MGRRRFTSKERATSLMKQKLKRKNKVNVLTRNVLIEKMEEKIIEINDIVSEGHSWEYSQLWWYNEFVGDSFLVRKPKNQEDLLKEFKTDCDFLYSEVYLVVYGEFRGCIIHRNHCNISNLFALWMNYS